MRQSVFFRDLRLGAVWLSLIWALLCPLLAHAQATASNKLASLNLSQAQLNDDGSYWGLLELTLAPHVKTYWRTAGEAGLPPRFDWTGSVNLADITLSWPAPIRFEDGGGHSIGYEKSLVLPLRVKPLDALKPVTLDLTLDYALCETLCLPMHERLRTVFDPSKAVTQARQIALQQALQRVPAKLELGSQDPLSVERVVSEEERLRLDLSIHSAWPIQDIFVEGPEGWVFGTPRPLDAETSPQRRFLVTVLERPERGARLANLTLAVTVVAPTKSAETVLTLDKHGRAP
jgi:DsbC/DsbD-like thiol-disulfide interchange protein